MPTIHMKVMLSSNRNQSGLLLVHDVESGKVLATFEALGRGSRGGGDTQMQVNGNTPTGSYRVERIKDTGAWNQSSYGPNGALELKPVSGNALAAETALGRKGLLVHGGSMAKDGYWRGEGELRATHGCIRLSDKDMKRLVDVLDSTSYDPVRNQSSELEIKLTVTDYDASFARP